MIERYERRAACTDDPQERRRYMEEKRECEEMIQILKNIMEVENDSRKIR